MENYPHIVYHDEHYLLCRKPYGLATTQGQEDSFLGRLQKKLSDSGIGVNNIRMQSPKELWTQQRKLFGQEGEFGLLNRLDTLTAGLLYFARSHEAKEKYKLLQGVGKIEKLYYAQVYGKPLGQFGRIKTPLYHHHFESDRMTTKKENARGRVQNVVTSWEVIDAGSSSSQESGKQEYSTTTRLRVSITRGCRHQIRAHLSSIGHPIVGDWLYMSKKQRKKHAVHHLQNRISLVSAGVIFEEKDLQN